MLENFFRGWLLVLVRKECLVEFATLCVKSEVILTYVKGVLMEQILCTPGSAASVLLIQAVGLLPFYLTYIEP